MKIIDNKTWVRMVADAGKDLTNADGMRVKSVSCPIVQQAAWSEVAELANTDLYQSAELTDAERLFLRYIISDTRASSEFVNILYSDKKITESQYDRISATMAAKTTESGLRA